MKISQAFPSKYLRAGDLQDKAHVVIVARIDMADIGQEGHPEQKPVLYFQGRDKGLVLNKTNAETLSFVYGDETNAWVGQPVEVYPDTVMFKGAVTPCIRVRRPVQAAQGQPVARQDIHTPLSSPDDLEDDIVF